MYIGANDYSAYDPEFCDGRCCCRDCGVCPVAEVVLEKEENEKSGGE